MTEKKLHKSFNKANIKGKCTGLILEHAPCCILSAAASYIGVQSLSHNPTLEFAFALGGAVGGEYLSQRIFSHCQDKSWRHAFKAYGISIAFGMATWGIHQQIFHHEIHVEHPHPH